VDADWEVEIGGGAPVIEALGPGWIDLRNHSERIDEVSEVAALPALGALLVALNGKDSPVWTSKCDVWEPEPEMLACYVDLLPVEGRVFADWRQAEAFCRECVGRLAGIELPNCSVELVVRAAIAGEAEGYGITAYLSSKDAGLGAAGALAAGMAAFADALRVSAGSRKAGSKLQ
jgi:hypothetical protein